MLAKAATSCRCVHYSIVFVFFRLCQKTIVTDLSASVCSLEPLLMRKRLIWLMRFWSLIRVVVVVVWFQLQSHNKANEKVYWRKLLIFQIFISISNIPLACCQSNTTNRWIFLVCVGDWRFSQRKTIELNSPFHHPCNCDEIKQTKSRHKTDFKRA